jgi:hypothetical protein
MTKRKKDPGFPGTHVTVRYDAVAGQALVTFHLHPDNVKPFLDTASRNGELKTLGLWGMALQGTFLASPDLGRPPKKDTPVADPYLKAKAETPTLGKRPWIRQHFKQHLKQFKGADAEKEIRGYRRS